MKLITKYNSIQEVNIWNISELPKAPNLACLQAEIKISYKDIVKVFGKETLSNPNEKVMAEWHIATPDGFAFIYDNKVGKQYDKEYGINKSDNFNWSIGGSSKLVVPYILKALNLN